MYYFIVLCFATYNYIILDQFRYFLLIANNENAMNIHEFFLNITHLFPTKGYVLTIYGSIISFIGAILLLYRQKTPNEFAKIILPLIVVFTGFIGMLMSFDWVNHFNLSFFHQGEFRPLIFISSGGIFVFGVGLYFYLNYIRLYLRSRIDKQEKTWHNLYSKFS